MPADTVSLSPEKEASSIILNTRRTRPRFFDGKFLTAADLTLEQSYLLRRQADLARTLGFGVVNGLRVVSATTSASNLPNPAMSVTVFAGHGLTPAGDLVYLPKPLTIDLDNVAQTMRLSAAFGLTREKQQPFTALDGLYILGLRAIEFTTNPTPAYPASLDDTSALRDGEIVEATAFTLVPYNADTSRKTSQVARAHAAREIFLEQKAAPLPAGVLPLAMLCIKKNILTWVDEWLVRREAGDDDKFGFGFAPRALAEAHFYQYQTVLDQETPSASPGQLNASRFLEVLPSAGPLPANTLNLDDFTQAYFPPEARVELALVPEDEIPALMEDAIDLPPIDLALKPEDQDALAILIMATIPRSDYGNTLDTLKSVPQPPIRNIATPLLGQQKPIQALLKLNTTFQLRKDMLAGTATITPATANFVDPAWRKALKKSGKFWYMRRRNLPDGKGLAGTPLPVTTTIPIDETGTTISTDTPTSTADQARSEIEAKLASQLATEGLWGNFAFLRAISDLPTHSVLTRLFTNTIVLENPILQHAIFTALEHAAQLISESPVENFEQIQKDSNLKVLTPAMIADAARKFANTDITRGIQLATKNNPKLITNQRLRYVLGRTNRIDTLASLALKYSDSASFKKLMAVVEKLATTGKAQAISDDIDLYIKKQNP